MPPTATAPTTTAHTGRLRVLYGDPVRPISVDAATLSTVDVGGAATTEKWGRVANAGDIDGDGVDGLDLAARWVDTLLPTVPVRQWVLTLPWHRRLLVSRNPEVARGVLGVEVDRGRLRRSRGGAEGGGASGTMGPKGPDGAAGTVTQTPVRSGWPE